MFDMNLKQAQIHHDTTNQDLDKGTRWMLKMTLNNEWLTRTRSGSYPLIPFNRKYGGYISPAVRLGTL